MGFSATLPVSWTTLRGKNWRNVSCRYVRARIVIHCTAFETESFLVLLPFLSLPGFIIWTKVEGKLPVFCCCQLNSTNFKTVMTCVCVCGNNWFLAILLPCLWNCNFHISICVSKYVMFLNHVNMVVRLVTSKSWKILGHSFIKFSTKKWCNIFFL